MVKSVNVVIAILLLVPLIALLDIPSYNSVNPSLFGISFFYWYQMLWMPLGALLYYIAATLWNREEKDVAQETGKRKAVRGRKRRR